MKGYLPLIIGMMLVTYLPRLIPLLLMTEKPLNPKLKRFLLYIPYTALSALIVRGILEASPGMSIATLVGIGAAGICSWFKGGLVLSVFISIVVVFVFLNI
ncbi:MAG: AzlD domain-containing protein [Bacillota bacterium]|nr:AzlD domain-containing protein [Bacillota bacterium]